MSSPYSALAAKIRTKFPGQYDDLSDDDLGKKIIAKHPEYQDLVTPVEPTPKPGALGRPAMPGVASRYAGPQSVALSPAQRESRNVPGEVANVVAPTLVTAAAPEAMLPGAVAQVAGRAMGGLAGASYGGKKAAELGLPKWTGQVAGGAAGVFAPEAIGKLSGPLLSRIATMLGKSAPEVAETIAADTTLAQRVGRDIAERAARGETLSPAEEETLLRQVQRHYTPEAGIESSASKSGKIYAGRGTSMRPTNEQIRLAKETGRELIPPPSPRGTPQVRFTTDSLGARWAHSPLSPEPVSIPKSVPEGEVQEYAQRKIDDYVKMRKGLGKSAPTGEVAYRARPVGEKGIPAASHPQATTDLAQARDYASKMTDAKGNPVPGEVVTIDLGKTPHTKVPHPTGKTWIKFGAAHPEDVIVDKSNPIPHADTGEFQF